jgi:hypothetical protein
MREGVPRRVERRLLRITLCRRGDSSVEVVYGKTTMM